MVRLGVACLFAILAISAIPSRAEWEFEANIYRFSNPSNQDFEGNCCESFDCNNHCDHYFTFCLRPKGYSGNACPRGVITTPPAAGQTLETDTATFSPGNGATFGPTGVSNPLVFQGNRWSGGGFQLFIRIEDDDTDANDLIDEIIITRNLAPRETFTTTQRYSGQHGAVTMDFSFRVRCSQNFFGSECTIFCEGIDDSTGHYVCDANGDKICLNGWTDVNSNCLTPMCAPGCDPPGGSCDEPGECTCTTGWSGELCDECVPATGCVHGTCVVPGDCNCNEGYDGTLCNIDQDVCGHQSPCANGGTCTNTGDDSYHCDCAPGFTGVDCDIDIDDCASSPCNNGGTCIDQVNGFICNCSNGWEGVMCDDNTDECLLSSPCQNGGTCIDCVPTLPSSINNDCELGFTCNCSTGFYGDNCEGDIDYCLSSPCQNNATCHDMETTYRCECAPGYTGRDCETEIDECASNPCKNGGTCEDKLSDYSCSCPPGYTGKDCDIDIDDCIDNKCVPENTVECVDEVNSYKCKCHPGYTGRFCDTEIDECDSSPCENGATCTDLFNDFICDCPEGFTGPLCTENIDDCHPDICLNGGTCVDELNNYTCSCVPGYTGRQCEDELPAPCDSNPCGADMFCVELLPVGFLCESCAPGDEGCPTPNPIEGNSTSSEPLGAIVGGAVGAAVALFLLLLLLVFCLCCCCRGLCCFVCGGRDKTEEDYGTITREGAMVNNNPMYFTPSDLESTRGSTASFQRSGVGRSMQNPSYALAQLAYRQSNPPLPPRNSVSSPNSIGEEADYHQYDTIPAMAVDRVPSKRTSGEYSRLVDTHDGSPDISMASGKYNQLKAKGNGSAPMAMSGKYDPQPEDSIQVTRRIDNTSHVRSTAENPYVMEPGASPLPGAVGYEEHKEPTSKNPIELEAIGIQAPLSRENPYATVPK